MAIVRRGSSHDGLEGPIADGHLRSSLDLCGDPSGRVRCRKPGGASQRWVGVDLNNPHPFRFLGLCARPKIDESLRNRLVAEAARIEAWDLMVLAAEYHEIVGLFHSHLQAAEVALPRQARRTLEGFVARARHSTSTHLEVLADILEIFDAEKIRTLVLKGGALSPTLYREASHRSLADLDLWVEPNRIEQAQSCLLKEGFRSHSAHGLPQHRHLAPVSRELDGIRVVVELHRSVPPVDSNDAADLLSRASLFEVQGRQAYTLGSADMLAQLHHHLVYHLVFHRSLRLKWVADLVGLAEGRAETIPWDELGSRYPAMPGALAMLHHITPLSKSVADSIGVSLEPREPQGLDQELSVLPRPRGRGIADEDIDIPHRPVWLASEGDRGLFDTLWPSTWRLRLFWGLDRSESLWIAHCRYVGRVIAFAVEIWRSHGGSWASLRRRPWFRSRLQPIPPRDSRS